MVIAGKHVRLHVSVGIVYVVLVHAIYSISYFHYMNVMSYFIFDMYVAQN